MRQCPLRISLFLLRGYIFQKLLLAWKFSWINKNCFFVKETDTFGHIVVWTTYTSHKDLFTPQHTAFEQSAACLSVFLELLPGLIPLTMLWHAGWTLEETIWMNMTYNYSTTIFKSILTQILCISCIIYNFSIWPWKILKKNENLYFSTRNLYILGKISSKYCSRIIVGHVHANGFL